MVVYGLGDLGALPSQTPAITVKNNEITDADLATLARFTDLQVLDLGGCVGITDNGLRQLTRLKKLKSLTLSGDRLGGSGLGHLHDLPALENLTLYSSQGVTDKDIAELAKMNQLTRLTLWWASRLTDDQLAQLCQVDPIAGASCLGE